MSPSLAITGVFDGFKELEDRLYILANLGVDPEEIRAVLLPGAELIANAWRAKVPRPGDNHPYATGQYRDSIQVAPSDSWEEGNFIGLDIFTDAVNEEDGFNYPEALEFGTSRMAAQPSAQPAFDENVDEALALSAKALDALIAARTA